MLVLLLYDEGLVLLVVGVLAVVVRCCWSLLVLFIVVVCGLVLFVLLFVVDCCLAFLVVCR